MTDVKGFERAGPQHGSANSKFPHSRSFRAATALLLLPQFYSEQIKPTLTRKAPYTRILPHRHEFCSISKKSLPKCLTPIQVVFLLDITSGSRDDQLFSLLSSQSAKPIASGIHNNSEEYTEPVSSLTLFAEITSKVFSFVFLHFSA